MGRRLLRVQVSVPLDNSRSGLTLHFTRPERWENPPEAIASIPGVWGNLLSFLGGPRSCIGYRFSLVEYVLHPFVND